MASTGSTLNNSINSLSGTLTSTYATINNLASTGSTLQSNISSTGSSLDNKIGSLSGTLTSTYATITNLASTGSTLNTKINDLSGYVNTQDNSISNNLISTGNTLQNSINSLSGSSVLLYGNQSIGGVKTFRDNVYINNLFVTGTETIVNTPQINIASNYLLLNLTGGAVDGGIFFVTGSGLTGVNDTGPIIGFDHVNKFKFGVSTRNSDLSTLPDIASVQDIQAYSGVADGKFSTITNLASTGNTLEQKISSLSGTLTSTYATITNLASTGSTLATNLASTGNTLNSSINSLSGTLTSTYATINNLASTGSTLDTKINNLSGYVNSTGSNILFTTGDQTINGNKSFTSSSTLTVKTISGFKGSSPDTLNLIAANDNTVVSNVNLAGNINLTAGTGTVFGASTYGSINLNGNININSNSSTIGRTINIYKTGLFVGIPTPINALTIDENNISLNTIAGGNQGFGLIISGVPVTPALYATSDNLASTGSTLVTNLASTGSTLNSSINSLSGTLTGNYLTTSSASSTYATITNLASTGSTLNTRINNLSGYINSTSSNIVFTTGDQTISGTKTFIQDTTFGDSAQGDFLVISGNNFTVYGSGNFTSGLFVNGNPVLTGSSTLYATAVNLASTGSTLDTKINNLSGVSVLRFGDQTISGIKTFATGVNISGNVGIGTITPFAKLHIAGSPALANTTMEDILYLQRPFNAGVAFGSRGVLRLGKYSTDGSQSFTRLDIALRSGSDDTTISTPPEINVMTLRADGNIGIGTTTPSERLTVVGNANISGNLNISGNYNVYSQIEDTKKLAIAYAIAL